MMLTFQNASILYLKTLDARFVHLLPIFLSKKDPGVEVIALKWQLNPNFNTKET